VVILFCACGVVAQTTPFSDPQLPGQQPNSQQQAPQQKTPPQPESAPGTYTVTVTTRLVVLDALVLDKKNNVVRGLTRDEFHIEELDVPQTIQNFEETGSQSIDPNLSIESTADLDRLAPRAPVNIVLLDEFNTRFEDMAFARYSLKKFLQSQPEKLSTPTMLLAVDLDNFSVLSDYTQNKDKLVSALDRHFAANPWRNQGISWAGARYATAFLTLRRVAEAVLGHRGHKSLFTIYGRGEPEVPSQLYAFAARGR
jgi:VWFA-related protein